MVPPKSLHVPQWFYRLMSTAQAAPTKISFFCTSCAMSARNARQLQTQRIAHGGQAGPADGHLHRWLDPVKEAQPGILQPLESRYQARVD
jgi:hypothetical protein